MCGRFNLKTSASDLAEVFAAFREPGFTLLPRYNIAPTQPVVVVRLGAEAQRTLAHVQWGLVPSWSQDPRSGAKMINARSETIDTKPAFRALFKRRRCLIPATGFYEWRTEGRKKIPFLIQPRTAQTLAFAGLWDVWTDPAGGQLETCTIITTTSNELLADLHDRMPVILEPADFEQWLTCSEAEAPSLKPLLAPLPSELLECFEVNPRVNNARHEGPVCTERVTSLFD